MKAIFRSVTKTRRNVFSEKVVATLSKPLRHSGIRPFFIVSSGRSGTTLLRKILLNSPQIHIPPESDDLIPTTAGFFISHNHLGWSELIEKILDSFQNASCFHYWHMDLSAMRKDLMEFSHNDPSYAGVIDLIYRRHGQDKRDVQVWGDKTPYLMYHLDELRAIFPEASYLHLVRDGRAVVHSMMKDQGYDLERAALRWRDSVRLFDRHRKKVSPGRVMETKYESLVQQPGETVKAICDFAGIEFSGDLLTNSSVSLGDDVLHHHRNLAKEINDDSVEKWRREMEPKNVNKLTRVIFRELKSRGYHID